MTDFEKVTDFNNLYNAYKKAKSGKGYKNSSAKFETQALNGIHKLKAELDTKRYTVSGYNKFYVYEPKKRLIEAAAFKDKIVQHSLCDNVLLPKLSEVFIRNNFAGQIGKGTLFGLNTLKDDMLSFYKTHGMSGYILKADVTKFFYTINHAILKQMLREYFSDSDLLWLCDLIIDSTDDIGLPLGNQTSQVFALLYLNELDHYITEFLGIDYYGRYIDDFYLIHQDKQYLKNCLVDINRIVHGLNLSLNGKTQIMPFIQGIKFLGFHTYIVDGEIVCRIRNENKRNAQRKYKKMAQLVIDGKLKREKFDECYQSWKAHARFGDCKDLIQNLDEIISDILKERMLMTYKELKQNQNRIAELNTEIAKLRADAEGTTQKLSQAPSGSGIKDKVGNLATQIAYYENQKQVIISEVESAIRSIPDDMTGKWLKMRINKRFSWIKIAHIAGGYNTPDSVRKKCERYSW